MSEPELIALAKDAGLSIHWTDAFGKNRSVSPDTLRAVLSALNLPADTSKVARDSRKRLRHEVRARATMIVAHPGETVSAEADKNARLTLESGQARSVRFQHLSGGRATFKAPKELGYHALSSGEREITLAVAPRKPFQPELPTSGAWAVAVQLYALHGGKTRGFGDFAALGDFVGEAARAGADAVAISPVHAPMPGPMTRYSPYSPSSRVFLNSFFAGIPSGTAALERTSLIDWKRASTAKLAALDEAYRQFRASKKRKGAFDAFVGAGGERLLAHARFEALSARFPDRSDWRKWPATYRDAKSASVQRLACINPHVEKHLFRQWLADTHLADVQSRARKAGMRIGVIADLATGMDPAGSHGWSAPDEVLHGLTIGAPPDPIAPEGQNWGVTALSPTNLCAAGYASFLATLRASMRHAGGIRIDHAMGIRRLWVIPEGARVSDGAYLAYPFDDLTRLVMLESSRHRAIVIGEDLGTVPPEFRQQMTAAGMFGLRVLWFERGPGAAFKPSDKWDRAACALTTTHDLPTVAGWWSGGDLDWRRRISLSFDLTKARRARAADRDRLWRALAEEDCADGEMPPPEQPGEVVDAALQFVAKTPSRLAIIPIEDVIGERDQQNIPGTIDEHPNWRRRLPEANGLHSRDATRRLKSIASTRPRK